MSNNKLIGIHNSKSKYSINGIFFKYIINEYECKYNYLKNKDNKIVIKIKVDEDDINKKIYFLNNESNNKNLEELNNLLINRLMTVFYCSDII